MAEENGSSAAEERPDVASAAETAKHGETADGKTPEVTDETAKDEASTSAEGAGKPPTPPSKADSEVADEWKIRSGSVNAEVRARNSFVNSVFHGPVYFRDAAGNPRLSIDQTEESRELDARYVGSETLSAVIRSLSAESVIVAVCGTSGVGKRSACLVAVRRQRDAPIYELPSDLGFEDLASSIEQIKSTVGNACFIMSNVDADFVGGLDEFQLAELRRQLRRSAPSCLLITTPGTLSRHGRSVVVVTATAVPAEQLITAYFVRNPADERTVARIHAVADQAGALSFPALDALVERLRADPDASDEDLLGALPGAVVTTALDEWFENGRSARELAALACVATCEDAPRADLDEQMDVLEASLLGDNLAPSGPPTFGRSSGDVVAKGVVATTTRPVTTHFGVHQESVYVLERHLDRVLVLEYLWTHAGIGFRKAFQEWLTTLSRHRSQDMQHGASIAAGVLLTLDPRYVESAIIRPWAMEDDLGPVLAVANALGVPTIMNLGGDVGQRLAKSWISTDDIDLRYAAIYAYGGPLGAWDLSCAAPVELWQAACEEDGLSRHAEHNLAWLCAVGPDAGHLRFAVLSLLADQLSGRLSEGTSVPRQALKIFALAVNALSSKDEQQAESLRSLLGGAEEAAKELFVLLLARTWSAGYARRSTERTIEALVRAAEEQVISVQTLVELIRAAKDSARTFDAVSQLGGGLRRGLEVERRERPDGSVVSRLLDQFFPNP